MKFIFILKLRHCYHNTYLICNTSDFNDFIYRTFKAFNINKISFIIFDNVDRNMLQSIVEIVRIKLF